MIFLKIPSINTELPSKPERVSVNEKDNMYAKRIKTVKKSLLPIFPTLNHLFDCFL